MWRKKGSTFPHDPLRGAATASLPKTSTASPVAMLNSTASDYLDTRGCDDGSSPAQLRRVPRWQGVFVASEIHEALSDMSSALNSCGIEHVLVVDGGEEPHISLEYSEILKHTGHSDRKSDRKIALMWGSTVHHVMDTESVAESHLSPAARFQVALLQKARGVHVVVVPHWWWLKSASLQDKCNALVRLVTY